MKNLTVKLLLTLSLMTVLVDNCMSRETHSYKAMNGTSYSETY